MFQKEKILQRYILLGIDILSQALALIVANVIRFKGFRLFEFGSMYLETLVVAMVGVVLTELIFRLNKNAFSRSLGREIWAVIRINLLVLMMSTLYLYVIKDAYFYSRLQMGLFIAISAVLMLIGHQLAKKGIAAYYSKMKGSAKLMLITTSDKAEEILTNISASDSWYFSINYLMLVDGDHRGEEICGIPVVAAREDLMEVSKELTLDGVYINVPYTSDWDVEEALREFQSMGVTVNVNISALELKPLEGEKEIAVSDENGTRSVTIALPKMRKEVDKLGFYKVVTYSAKLPSPWLLAIKRLADILGSLVGLIITGLVSLVLIPAIHIDSPGPAFFAQERVGKNGRRFKIYKFRSMYRDAEARKVELMAKNEMSGAIFKITDDPRITKVGAFIRKTSLDELPQFWNVFKGDMSLVGTRPPTVDEVSHYRIDQKRRLSMTPGLTGMWQTSGRSSILDFDEIVRMDLDYIDHWSLGLDIKLIFKTFAVVFKRDGAK